MSYEYGTGQQGLNYPNPYTIENKVILVRTIIFFIMALGLLGLAKIVLDKSEYVSLLVYLAIATGFLYLAITSAYRLSQQYQVYFGRGQPASLAVELPLDQHGTSESASKLKETIRQGALTIEPPTNPLSGFLYSHFPHLIIAPKDIRTITEHLFSNIIKLIIVGGLFLLSWFFSLGGAATGWLGVYFFSITFFLIVKPLLHSGFSQVNLTLSSFWKIFAASLLAPIVLISLGDKLPDISGFHFGTQSIVILLCTLAGEVMSLYALKSHLYTPTGITTAYEQESISFNAPPSQLNLEIDRKLQQEWIATIPNRIYSSIVPTIPNSDSGSFKGQIIQETQPMVPQALQEKLSFNSMINNPRLKKLFIIDCFALAFTLFSTVAIFYILLNWHYSTIKSWQSIAWLPTFICMLCLSSYWIKIAHELWGRFDFESKLYVFEWEGSFSKAKMNFGNRIKDTIHTQKDIINIESMTLRVWVIHLNTVVFGHGLGENKPRHIISMIGLKDEAKHWIEYLKSFATQQSMMLKPNENEDFVRAQALSQLNQVSSGRTSEIRPSVIGATRQQLLDNNDET